MTDVRVCRKCGEAALHISICEDCEKDRKQGKIKRRAQPKDPTVYVPDFDGLRGFDEIE